MMDWYWVDAVRSATEWLVQVRLGLTKEAMLLLRTTPLWMMVVGVLLGFATAVLLFVFRHPLRRGLKSVGFRMPARKWAATVAIAVVATTAAYSYHRSMQIPERIRQGRAEVEIELAKIEADSPEAKEIRAKLHKVDTLLEGKAPVDQDTEAAAGLEIGQALHSLRNPSKKESEPATEDSKGR